MKCMFGSLAIHLHERMSMQVCSFTSRLSFKCKKNPEVNYKLGIEQQTWTISVIANIFIRFYKICDAPQLSTASGSFLIMEGNVSLSFVWLPENQTRFVESFVFHHKTGVIHKCSLHEQDWDYPTNTVVSSFVGRAPIFTVKGRLTTVAGFFRTKVTLYETVDKKERLDNNNSTQIQEGKKSVLRACV